MSHRPDKQAQAFTRTPASGFFEVTVCMRANGLNSATRMRSFANRRTGVTRSICISCTHRERELLHGVSDLMFAKIGEKSKVALDCAIKKWLIQLVGSVKGSKQAVKPSKHPRRDRSKH